jgi:hypothetical protein
MKNDRTHRNPLKWKEITLPNGFRATAMAIFSFLSLSRLIKPRDKNTPQRCAP